MSGTFSKRLKEIRDSKGWTQQQFADWIGCSRATYNHYENGKRHPDDEILKTICEKTGVSADYLLGLSITKNPSLDSTARVTGLSEKALEYLRVKTHSSRDSILGPGLENKILDFIIRDASFSDVFDSANPNPFVRKYEAFFGETPAFHDKIKTKCPIHILDSIKKDWGDEEGPWATPENDASLKEQEELIESLGGYDALDPFTSTQNRISAQDMSEAGLLDMAEEEFLDKQADFLSEEGNKSLFLDTLIKYLLFDEYDVSLCSSLGYQELSEERSLTIRLGNTSICFPSEESSQLIENMLLQNVMDSLKVLKRNLKDNYQL